MIDIGTTYDDAGKESQKTGFKAFDEGDYELQILAAEPGTSSRKRRPKLGVRFEVINHPEVRNRSVWKDFPLPYRPAPGAEFDTSGLGMLAQLYKGCGLEWSGTQIDETQLIGAICRAKISKTQKVNANNEPVFLPDGTPDFRNEVERIYNN